MAVDLSLSYGLNCISSIHMYSLGVNFFGHRAFKGFPGDSVGKESPCNAGDLGFIPRRSPGEGKGYPLQYYGLENSMDCIVNGVTKSWTLLSNFHFSPSYWDTKDICDLSRLQFIFLATGILGILQMMGRNSMGEEN